MKKMKKTMAILVVMLMLFEAVTAFAAGITITLDGEVVTDKAYIDSDITLAPLSELEETGSDEIVAVRKYYEDKGFSVGWNGETKTVEVSSSKELFGNFYRIVNKKTGNVMVVEGYNTENLALIVTEPLDTQNRNQIFKLTKIDEEYGYFMNLTSSRALDVPDARIEEGVQLIQYSFNSNTQQWMKIEDAGDGYYTIAPKHCDMFLAEKDGKVVQVEDETADESKWKLEIAHEKVAHKLKDTPGYQLLDERYKGAVGRFFSGNIFISRIAKENAETVFAREGYKDKTPEEQAELIKEVLTISPVGAAGGELPHDNIAEYKIVGKEYNPAYDIWRGNLEPCWLYSVEMAGDTEGQLHKFTMVSNQEDVPMVERAIEALARTPYALRRHVKRLIWKAGDNANNYNGGNNTIWIRLNWEPPTSKHISGVLCHELGHVLHFNTLFNNDIWTYAASLDYVPVSGYGTSNMAEDIADFNKTFLMLRGTEEFKYLEELYPNRFKVYTAMLYRSDSEYFAEYAENEAYIAEIEKILAERKLASEASEIDDTKYYVIKDKTTGKVWTIENNSLENDANVVLKDYEEGNDAQRFAIQKNGDTVRFYSKLSGCSLQLTNSSLPSMRFFQYGGTWAVDEQFIINKTDDGFVFESARYALSLAGRGERVVSDLEGNGSVFEMIAIEENTSNADYTIKVKGTDDYINAVDSEKYMLVQASKTPANWKVKEAADGVYQLVYSEKGTLIDILDLSKAAGRRAILWTNTGADNQKFVMEDVNGGVMFKAIHSGLYLTVNADGTVTQEVKDVTKKQIFSVKKAG